MPWVTRKPSTAFSQLVCQFFLLGRSQFVCVNQATFSKSLEVTCGIPQGSVLATFLFAAHMGSLWCHTVGPHAWPSMLTMFSVSSLWWLGRFCAQRHSTRWLLVQFEWVTAEQVKNKDPHLLQQDINMNSPKVNLNITQCTQLKIFGLTYTNNLSWDTNVLSTKNCRRMIKEDLYRWTPNLYVCGLYDSIWKHITWYNMAKILGLLQRSTTVRYYTNSISRKTESVRKLRIYRLDLRGWVRVFAWP